MNKDFTDEIARNILEKHITGRKTERTLIKTIHRAEYDEEISCIIYSLSGTPARGNLILFVLNNKIKTIRLFDYWGNQIKRISKYSDYDIKE